MELDNFIHENGDEHIIILSEERIFYISKSFHFKSTLIYLYTSNYRQLFYANGRNCFGIT